MDTPSPSAAAVLLVLGGTLEMVGPLCILFGFYRRQVALLFIFYVIATAVLFHNFWSFPFNSNEWNHNFWPFLKNFGLVGGFLFVAAEAKMQSLGSAFSLPTAGQRNDPLRSWIFVPISDPANRKHRNSPSSRRDW